MFGVAPALFAGSSGSGSFRVDAGGSSQKEFFEFKEFLCSSGELVAGEGRCLLGPGEASLVGRPDTSFAGGTWSSLRRGRRSKAWAVGTHALRLMRGVRYGLTYLEVRVDVPGVEMG